MSYTITDRDIAFARKQASRYCSLMPPWADTEAVTSAALEGLCQAACSYDATDRCVAFTTWAYHRVWGAMKDECRAQDYLKRGDRDSANAMLNNEELLPPSLLSPESLNKSIIVSDKMRGEPTELQEVILGGIDPATMYESKIMPLLERLNPQERYVLIASLCGFSGVEISRSLGVSESRISQVRTRATNKLGVGV